jgi:DNA-binding response OmpR family regulator
VNETRSLLVVEDDRAINDAVTLRLRSAGYEVVSVFDGPSAVAEAGRRRFDAVVLDLMLPGLGGIDVCRAVQAVDAVPVLMLTARADEADKLAGLDAGADDYLIKPFSPRELVARVNALLRRVDRAAVAFAARRAAQAVITVGALHLDGAARRVTVADQDVTLTRTEFDLLLALALEAGRPVSRERLLVEVWGWRDGDPAVHATGAGRTVDSHVRGLRAKIGGHRISTVHGIGYRLEAPVTGGIPGAVTGGITGAVTDGVAGGVTGGAEPGA